MRIGLVTDIHDHVEPLRRALELFRQRGVDAVVTLGDTCDAFTPCSRCGEVVDLLRQANAVGVWGNHDVGLCRHVDDRIRQRFPAKVQEFMATIQPRLVMGGCHLSHVEPCVDPHDVRALWSFDEEGPLDMAGRAQRSFAAVGERFVFIGHYHRWLILTPRGPLDWQAEEPVTLLGEHRYFVVVGAVFQGHCGIFDTALSKLWPLRC
jgi:predicted phosphodiesterase